VPEDQRVRAAAVRLFAERGFHGTGIRDLAEAAGLSSSTLYHYMGSKEELLAAVMRDSLGRLLALGSEIAASGTPADRLAALVAMHVREHAEQRLETSVVDGELRALTGPRLAEVLALRDAYEALWQQVLEDGRADGSMGVEDPGLARLALLEMCSGVARWFDPGGRLELSVVTERYVAMALALVEAS
jgi:AcrR family transcriptional regulator